MVLGAENPRRVLAIAVYYSAAAWRAHALHSRIRCGQMFLLHLYTDTKFVEVQLL